MRSLGGLIVALGLILGTPAGAAERAVRPLFASQEVLHITLRGPISRLIGDRSNASQPVEASLSVAGEPAILPVKLSLRGIMRRRKETCDFPPIRIDFPDRVAEGSIFAGQKKLKLTTHCNTPLAEQQNVLVEYAAYRMYEVLTPVSFKARLVQVDYVNADGRPLISRVGMLLENDRDVARRNGLALADVGDTIQLAQLSAHDAARQALFEYMISNLDWSMLAGVPGSGCCHNTKLLAPKGVAAGFTPLPYDYDFSGLVNAPYATPPEGFDVPDVVTRLYRGHCAYNAEVLAVAGEFRAKRGELSTRLAETPGLEDGRRRRALAYLDEFFRLIATDRDVSERILKTCIPGR